MMRNPLHPAFLDADILDGFCQGALLCTPVYTAACLFLFMWTGLPLFLLYACIGAAGNVVLAHSLRRGCR